MFNIEKMTKVFLVSLFILPSSSFAADADMSDVNGGTLSTPAPTTTPAEHEPFGDAAPMMTNEAPVVVMNKQPHKETTGMSGACCTDFKNHIGYLTENAGVFLEQAKKALNQGRALLGEAKKLVSHVQQLAVALGYTEVADTLGKVKALLKEAARKYDNAKAVTQSMRKNAENTRVDRRELDSAGFNEAISILDAGAEHVASLQAVLATLKGETPDPKKLTNHRKLIAKIEDVLHQVDQTKENVKRHHVRAEENLENAKNSNN